MPESRRNISTYNLSGRRLGSIGWLDELLVASKGAPRETKELVKGDDALLPATVVALEAFVELGVTYVKSR